MTTNTKLIISIVLVALGVACRLLPHFWNFTPLAAIALFSGFYLGRRYAIALPLASMLIGDLFIGFYDWKLMFAVYGSLVLAGLFASFFRKHKSVETVLASAISASVIFFILTNWAVWQFSPWYEKTFAGLIQCYILALPFFRGTFLGDIFYVAVLFGAYEAISIWAGSKKLILQRN